MSRAREGPKQFCSTVQRHPADPMAMPRTTTSVTSLSESAVHDAASFMTHEQQTAEVGRAQVAEVQLWTDKQLQAEKSAKPVQLALFDSNSKPNFSAR
jgi:hypothetical protein